MKFIEKQALVFEGFFSEEIKHKLPSYSGLYFVYRGITITHIKPTCNLRELLYIGQAKDVNTRVSGEHEHYEEWDNLLKSNEMLYYSTCEVNEDDLDRIEAACIYAAQPRTNIQCKDSYNHSPISIVCSGRVKFIDAEFTLVD